MILGYHLIAHEINQRILEVPMKLGLLNPCAEYQDIFQINYFPADYKMPRRTSDIYISIDGFLIISPKVYDYLLGCGYQNLEFRKLPNDDFFWMITSNFVKYDAVTRGTRFLSYSEKCEGYREIVGATPVCLLENNEIGDNFFRTDICFGNNGRSPVYCIGISTYEKLKKENFKGLVVDKILDKYKLIPPTKLP